VLTICVYIYILTFIHHVFTIYSPFIPVTMYYPCINHVLTTEQAQHPQHPTDRRAKPHRRAPWMKLNIVSLQPPVDNLTIPYVYDMCIRYISIYICTVIICNYIWFFRVQIVTQNLKVVILVGPRKWRIRKENFS
jgi:hypothetical protein